MKYMGASESLSQGGPARLSVWRTMLEGMPTDQADRKVLEMGRRVLAILSGGGVLELRESADHIEASHSTAPTNRLVVTAATPFAAVEKLLAEIERLDREVGR